MSYLCHLKQLLVYTVCTTTSFNFINLFRPLIPVNFNTIQKFSRCTNVQFGKWSDLDSFAHKRTISLLREASFILLVLHAYAGMLVAVYTF